MSTASEPETTEKSEPIDPLARLTPEQKARFAAYMASPRPLPTSSVDRATGRLLEISEEELQRRWAACLERMAAIEAERITDPPGTFERMAREINEDRIRDGMRPVFRGY